MHLSFLLVSLLLNICLSLTFKNVLKNHNKNNLQTNFFFILLLITYNTCSSISTYIYFESKVKKKNFFKAKIYDKIIYTSLCISPGNL